MISWPPATTISQSPVCDRLGGERDGAQARAADLLTPQAGEPFGMPAAIEAWRAGFWPWPAVSTWPRITSETRAGFNAAALQRGLDDAAPSSCAGVVANEPLKLPTAVRAAPTMTTSSFMGKLLKGLGSVELRVHLPDTARHRYCP